jgi:hypothetical protein
MPIIVNLDVTLAKRKMRSKETCRTHRYYGAERVTTEVGQGPRVPHRYERDIRDVVESVRSEMSR